MTDTANPPLDLDAVMQRYAVWERAAAALVPENKARLFAFLASARITRVIVTFDGEGDSGQIEDIQPYKGEKEAKLPKGKVELLDLPYGARQVNPRKCSATDALEALVYELLREKHDGWENSDGAYGDFTFDVSAGTITLDYNARCMSSEAFQHNW